MGGYYTEYWRTDHMAFYRFSVNLGDDEWNTDEFEIPDNVPADQQDELALTKATQLLTSKYPSQASLAELVRIVNRWEFKLTAVGPRPPTLKIEAAAAPADGTPLRAV